MTVFEQVFGTDHVGNVEHSDQLEEETITIASHKRGPDYRAI